MKTSGRLIFFAKSLRAGFVLVALFVLMSLTFGGDSSKGTLIYKGKKKTFNIDLKYAYFVAGPDSFDPNKKIRRLIFTNVNLEAKIKSCEVMNCVDSSIEGIQVDLDAADRILYWVNLNGQLVQYSGTAMLDAMVLTTESKDRLAGSLKIDALASGGPSVDVSFDVTLLKSYLKSR